MSRAAKHKHPRAPSALITGRGSYWCMVSQRSYGWAWTVNASEGARLITARRGQRASLEDAMEAAMEALWTVAAVRVADESVHR